MADEIKKRNRDFLEFLTHRGWRERRIPERAEALAERSSMPTEKMISVYRRRLERELAEIEKRNVVDYLLLVRSIVAEANRRSIAVGPGRGSAAGSLVLYLLGVTGVDPIEHGLLFERFLAPGRIDLPDIDIDFEDRRRDELVDWLVERYGRDHVARVGTVSTLGARSLVRDLGRVMMLGISDVNRISTLIDPGLTLRSNYEMIEEVWEFLELYPDVLRYADVIEGTARSLGVHAAGIVVSPVPIRDVTPVELRDDAIVTAFDLNGVSDCGLLKIDLLGLKTLTVIKDAIDAVRRTAGKTVDLPALALDDAATLSAFTAGDFVGVFQFDSASASTLCRGVEFTGFDVIVAMTALDRPGTARSGLAQTYLARNKGAEEIEPVHPIYDAITSDTFGVPVYQEHVIRLCRDLGGFTPEEADTIRKLVGKSKGAAALAEFGDKFIDGAHAKGLNAKAGAELWRQLCEFGGYSFNKSHATAYSILAYWTQYLKVHHPAAFFFGLIKNEKKSEKILPLVREAELRGVHVVTPPVSRAGTDYRIDGSEIIPALTHIKFVSATAAEAIEKEQPFSSFGDFLTRTKVNKRVVESLLSAGSLRDLVPNTKAALEHLDRLMKLKASPKIAAFVEASRAHDDFDKERLDEIASEVNPFVIRIHPIEKAAELIERVGLKVKFTSDVAANDSGFILGFVSDVKEGEFEGSRFATFEIDTGAAKPEKFKLDSSLTADLDRRGLGLPTFIGDVVVAHYLRSYKLPTLQFVVSLSDLDNDLRAGKKLDVWSRLVRGELPPASRILANVRTIVDKNKHEMAFLTVMSNARAVEGVCFASTWGEAKGELKVGAFVSVAVKKEFRDGKTSVIFRKIRRAPLP